VSRYSILMHLALTGLAALGADALIRRARQRWQAAGARVSALSAAAICVAACVALFEFWMLPVQRPNCAGGRLMSGWRISLLAQ